MGQASRGGDVFEFEIGFLMVEGDQRIAALFEALDGGSVHCNDVELAVIVAVNESNTATHGFDNVTFFGG